MAFFRNEEELSVYISSDPSSQEWIGYYQTFPEDNDIYETVDGEKAIFLKWDIEAGEPSSNERRCVKMKPQTLQRYN